MWTVRRSSAARAVMLPRSPARSGDSLETVSDARAARCVASRQLAWRFTVEAEDASHARHRTAGRAFSARVCRSTGWRSNVERLITFSTRPVAVCCSSAIRQLAVPCLELREQPHVLDRDDRLVGEGLEQLHLLGGNGPGCGRCDDDRTDGLAVAQHRHAEQAPEVRPASRSRAWYSGSSRDVGDVDDARGRGSTRPRACARDWVRIGNVRRRTASGLWPVTPSCATRWIELAVERDTRRGLGPAQLHARCGDCVEHGLHVGRRAADDAQDLAGRRLLLQRSVRSALRRLAAR